MANEVKGVFSEVRDSARGAWQATRGFAGNMASAGTGAAQGAIGMGGFAVHTGRSMLDTSVGGAVKRGFAETFGFQHYKGVSEGWLGWKKTGYGEAYLNARDVSTKAAMPKADPLGGYGMGPKSKAAYAKRKAAEMSKGAALAKATGRQAGRQAALAAGKKGGLSMAAGAAGKLGMGALAPIFTAYNVKAGYKEGGIAGAAGAFATDVALFAAFELIGGPVTMALGAAAGVGYGVYAAAGAAQEHHRSLRKLEMGGTMKDPFGTISTTRQRSLMALNNSHINGRMALGQEASLMHTNAYGG